MMDLFQAQPLLGVYRKQLGIKMQRSFQATVSSALHDTAACNMFHCMNNAFRPFQ